MTKNIKYVSLIKDSLDNQTSKLPNWILEMDGMSGVKYRHFINNLINSLEDPRYLEIGCWKGSTLCSAIFGNKMGKSVISCLPGYSTHAAGEWVSPFINWSDYLL